MRYRPKDSQSGVGVIAGQQNDLDRSIRLCRAVEREQALDEWKRDPWRQNDVFVGPLVLPILLDATLTIYSVRVAEIEEGA